MRPPPRWVRRLVIAPIVVALGVVALVVTPLALLIFLALISLGPARAHAARGVARLRLSDLGCRGPHRAVHPVDRVGVRLEAALAGIPARPLPCRRGRAARALLGVRVIAAPQDRRGRRGRRRARTVSVDEVFAPGIPLIVASRHAGPGDSFILIHVLLNRVHRMPRIVLAQKLQWDPAIDVLLSRIPSRFIAPAGFGPTKTGRRRPRGGRDRRTREGHGAGRCVRHLSRGRQLHRAVGAGAASSACAVPGREAMAAARREPRRT